MPHTRTMDIRQDDLSGPGVAALLTEHLRDMHTLSPPESVRALDLTTLRQPGITFWCAWSGPDLLGCGALKQLDARRGEIKSMRTTKAHPGHSGQSSPAHDLLRAVCAPATFCMRGPS